MKVIQNISYGQSENNVLDMYISEKENSPVYIYFHGGGLEGGAYNNPSEKELMTRMANKGITAISVEYRMYPEAKFPDYVEDAADAVLWVKNNIEKYTSYSDIFVGGSSAGGYISQMLCFDKHYFEERGITVAGYIHDAGQPTTHFNVLKERGICDKNGNKDYCRVLVDDAAPLYYVDGTEEYPPMLFVVSDNDLPNRYEQTLLLISVLRNYGCDMDKIKLTVMQNTTHCSYINKIAESDESLYVNEVCEFINNTRR